MRRLRDNSPRASIPDSLRLLTGADLAFLLHGDPQILKGVREAIRTRLGQEHGAGGVGE
jgi:hypothetical protein